VPLLQAFPFPSTLGKVILHLLSQVCMIIYSSCGKWVFPPLLYSFPPTATFTSFPAPEYWVVLLLLPAAVFVYSSHGKWVFPPLLWSFPPSATLTSFPACGCWVHLCSRQSISCPPGLFIYSSGKDSLPPIFSAQCSPPSFSRVFIVLMLISQFLFFPRVEVSLSTGLCCCGPGSSVGVPRYCEAHLVFPSRLGMGDCQPGGPPCFSV
jgi:hypothetical protein